MCGEDPMIMRLFRQAVEQDKKDLDDWLAMHRGITLVDFQLDAQNSY